ncbi:SipW-dependent-type signal peptide-containing protein [Robinsoniella sp. KNHs210]|uniref:SipW-dependent-type signal peptide-containing protein n=1 Tax=Robinsoniella sp. KNHs210 TaxID=1469950 RepID=UPI000488DCBF|nr:SipW-dependent-type signal peptide-containing protein [Robinsoniella sp. KNHs210]
MKKKSLVTMVAAVCLTGVVMVGATLAYLTSTTDVAQNTFTVGKVEIDLNEKTGETNEDFTKETEWNDTTDGKNMYPGQEVAKRPVVTVNADSADCWVYVQVSGADDLVSKNFTIDGWNTDWIKTDETISLDGIYKYKDKVLKQNKNNILPAVFTSVKYNEKAEGNLEGTVGTVNVVAAAIQADGIDEAKALEEATAQLSKALNPEA